MLLYTSSAPASYPLYLDTSIYTNGAWLNNVRMGGATTQRSYYVFNGRPVAIRENNVVMWIHGDQLGSASLTTNAGGAKVKKGQITDRRTDK